MKPKLTVEYGINGFLSIRHDGHLWEIYPDEQSMTMTHRTPSGVWDKEFYSTVEIEKKILDLVTQRLALSDFWNGQKRLF